MRPPPLAEGGRGQTPAVPRALLSPDPVKAAGPALSPGPPCRASRVDTPAVRHTHHVVTSYSHLHVLVHSHPGPIRRPSIPEGCTLEEVLEVYQRFSNLAIRRLFFSIPFTRSCIIIES